MRQFGTKAHAEFRTDKVGRRFATTQDRLGDCGSNQARCSPYRSGMALRVTDVLNAPLITEPGAIHNVGLASFACLNLSAQEWGEKMRSCYETQNVCSFLQPFD